MKKYFQKNVAALPEIFDFIQSFCTDNKLDEEVKFKIEMVVEELFTNIVKYNKQHEDQACIALSLNAPSLRIQIIDFDSDEFNLTDVPEYDTQAAIDDRPIGKIGIHLIKKLMDQVEYTYENRISTITLTKKIEATNA